MGDRQEWLSWSHRNEGATASRLPRVVLSVCVAGLACLGAGRASAEDALTRAEPPVRESVVVIDSEINLGVVRAMEAMAAGERDVVLPLLSRLLRSNPDAMVSTNGVTYLPGRTLAIALARTIPEEDLAEERLQAEASLRQILAGAPPSKVLAALERLYLNSLPGPAAAEAGMRLAGLCLDQGRYVDARAILLRLLDEYTPEEAPRPELLARLVVACSRAGDAGQAELAWAELGKAGGTNRWSALSAELSPTRQPIGPASNAWTMAYGSVSRDGLPSGASRDLEAADEWALRWGLNLGPGLVRGDLDTECPTNMSLYLCMSRDHAVSRMLTQNTRPSDDVIFAGKRAWVSGLDELVAVDLDAGRTIQRTACAADEVTSGMEVTDEGGWVFGNRLNRSSSLIGSRVYRVERNSRSGFAPRFRVRMERISGKALYLPLPCGNVLAAYEADTGRLLWHIGRETPAESRSKTRGGWQVNAIRFAAAPVPCAGLLLVPVEDDAGLGVVGLDPDSGALVWRTHLTSRLPTLDPRAAPVTVTVDGAQAYVCGGNGSVSALDAYDGSVRWTTLYKPSDELPPTNVESRLPKPGGLWEESLALVAGESIVAMPEDSAEIMAFDRRSGARLWTRNKPAGAEYVVGRRGESLVVAGRQTVACVDLADGRERWRTAIEGSTGRGALYGRHVLVPHGRRILRLRLEDGRALEPARAQTMDGLPLGNLYARGSELLVAGLERLYALADARPELAMLEESLKQQPTADAYAERGGFYAGVGRYPEAVADLREAWKRRRGQAGEAAARGALMTTLWRAAEQDAGAVETFGAEAREVAQSPAERAEATWRWAQCRERAGNTNGAMALYAAVSSFPDTSLSPVLGDTDWKASVHRLAAERIRALARDRDAEGWAPVEQPAAQALARLGSKADATALIELAAFFPGTMAGTEAARKAAQIAAGRGDLGTAEAILQRTLAETTRSNRVVLAGDLVRLYERMKWPKGTTLLRNDWPWLGGGAPMPEVLARAATNAAGVPPPPWRLRWRARLPPGTGIHVVPAGLYYWNDGAKQTACLDLETGQPRWQKNRVLSRMTGAAADWNDRHLLLAYTGEAGACVDAWSGAVMTHPLLKGSYEWIHDSGGHDRNPVTLSRFGLATVRYSPSDLYLGGLDLLTDKVTWRRGDADVLMRWWSFSWTRSASRLFLSDYRWSDGGRFASAVDLWTGGITGRRTFDPGEWEAWEQRLNSRKGCDDPAALDRSVPVLENRRLTVKNLRTGAAIWSSAPDLPVAAYKVMPGGTVLAQCDADELALVDGEDGHTRFRSGAVRFHFINATSIGNVVLAIRRLADATNETMAIDVDAGRMLFHGRLPGEWTPLAFYGDAMPGHFLVGWRDDGRGGIRVVNGRGQDAGPWRLPFDADSRGTPDGPCQPVLLDGLILMWAFSRGEVLAYEHDPSGK